MDTDIEHGRGHGRGYEPRREREQVSYYKRMARVTVSYRGSKPGPPGPSGRA